MLFRTHLAFGLLSGLLFVKWLNISYFWLILVMFFSVFVDIDEYKSKVGKKVIFLSFVIKLLFKHRGLIHSLILPLIIFGFLWFFDYFILGLSILIGYGSHLLLDILNISGIRLFYPISNFKVKGFVKTGSMLENILFVLILVGIGYLLW